MAKPRVVPLTTDSFLDAANGKRARPENKEQKREKPRASGLNGCVRQQWYDMSMAPRTNKQEEDPSRRDAVVTQELGRHAEDYTAYVIPDVISPLVEPEMDGLRVIERQINLPEDYFVTGHPDGALAQYRMEPLPDGPFGAMRTAETRELLSDGRKWGFEHKVYGAYQYKRMLEGPLMQQNPDLFAQTLLYGDALGWDAAIAVILSADAALIRGEMTRARKYAEEGKTQATRDKYEKIVEKYRGKSPKVNTQPIWLEGYYGGFIPVLRQRAADLSGAVEAGTLVARERDPDSHPLCGYCDWKDRCVDDGDGGLVIEPTPLSEED